MGTTAKQFSKASLKIGELSHLVGHSAQARSELALVLAPHMPDVVRALIEMSKGVWIDIETTTNAGLPYKRVYQRAPNPRAVNIFLRHCNYDIAELGNALLALSKVVDVQAGIAAKLPEAKAKNLASQTLLNEKNGVVFTASLVTQEDVLKAAMEVFSGLLSFIQMHPVEVMQSVVSSTETWQEWQMKAMREAQKAYARAVGVDEDDLDDLPALPQIGAKNTDDDDETDDDEAEEPLEGDNR